MHILIFINTPPPPPPPSSVHYPSLDADGVRMGVEWPENIVIEPISQGYIQIKIQEGDSIEVRFSGGGRSMDMPLHQRLGFGYIHIHKGYVLKAI